MSKLQTRNVTLQVAHQYSKRFQFRSRRICSEFRNSSHIFLFITIFGRFHSTFTNKWRNRGSSSISAFASFSCRTCTESVSSPIAYSSRIWWISITWLFSFRFDLIEKDDKQFVFRMGSNKIILLVEPFKLEFYNNDELVIVANDFGRFVFEHYRQKPEGV